ncbi:MAG: adenosylmethionine--8-amino-7-oxononanoate transaminase [Halofilum sp. (in: g-proteobacteria)]|nr:adenosylmethionine--8-amino-7-oxononanoate transaminase [Halofilum sp. (in: g-proteobacteria)]
MNNRELIERDLSVVWHPCTQMKDHESWPPIPFARGEGVYLEDYEGNRYIDAVSSWWVNLFGHANPRINAAIADQLERVEHVMMAGFTHEPVVQLSERLVALTPEPLTRCFYADNGSSGIEAALKMSFHYWRNVGEGERTKFIALSNSYHGETLGALAVGDVDLYKKTYSPLLMESIVVEGPDCFHREQGEDWKTHSRRMFAHMERALERHAHETCAVIVEPLVQCAGQMRMYHPVYLALLREACDRHGVHLIADEIAVGFGRTGPLFACEQAGISPDFLCLSKGITGGYLPLCAVLTGEAVYHAFYDEFETLRAFLHSHSYTGNPLACRAALATLDIFAEDDVITANRERAAILRQALAEAFDGHPQVGDVRQHGMVAAVEMCRNGDRRDPFPWQERRGLRVYRHGLTRGCLLRPLGNTIYFMPPYVITGDEIRHLVAVAREGIDRATAD